MMTAVSDDLDSLYRELAAELLRYATVLVGRASAPDVMTEAFLSAVNSPGWAAVTDRRAYLYRCVLNRARSDLRSRSRAERREYLAVSLRPKAQRFDAGGSIGSWAAASIDVDVVRALRSLSPKQRAVVYLTYWEDQTRPRIAELLGMSEGSVDQHLSRARKHLRRTLDV